MCTLCMTLIGAEIFGMHGDVEIDSRMDFPLPLVFLSFFLSSFDGIDGSGFEILKFSLLLYLINKKMCVQ